MRMALSAVHILYPVQAAWLDFLHELDVFGAATQIGLDSHSKAYGGA